MSDSRRNASLRRQDERRAAVSLATPSAATRTSFAVDSQVSTLPFTLAATAGSAALALAARAAQLELQLGGTCSIASVLILLVTLIVGWRQALGAAVIVALFDVLGAFGPAPDPTWWQALLPASAVGAGVLLSRGGAGVTAMASQLLPAFLLRLTVFPPLLEPELFPLLLAAMLEAVLSVAIGIVTLALLPRRGGFLPKRTRLGWEHLTFAAIGGATAVMALTLQSRPLVLPNTWTRGQLQAAEIAALLGGALLFAYALAIHLRTWSRRIFDGLFSPARTARTQQLPSWQRLRLPRELAKSTIRTARQVARRRREQVRQGRELEAMHAHSQRLSHAVDKNQRLLVERSRQLRQTAHALDCAKARYRVLMNHSSDAIIFITHDGVIESASHSTAALLGLQPQALKGRSIGALVPADQAFGHPLDPVTLAEVQEGQAQTRTTLRTAEGRSVQASVSIHPFGIRDERHLAVRILDAGGAKAAAATLQRAQQLTESAQRSRDLFIAAMSHELRTPLHGLLATLDMLRDAPDVSQEFQQRLSVARLSARSLLKIANDILDLSRLNSGHFTLEQRPFALRRLVEEVAEESRARAESLRIATAVKIDGALPPAFLGDATRLKQVLHNLVSNGLRFTQHGGVTLGVSYHGGPVTIDVIDTGCGIPEDKHEAIFDPFVQAQPSSQGGAGLGLTISRNLARAMGGDLTLLRSSDSGSVFRLSLQLEPLDEAPPDDQSQRIFATPRGRILVVEDNSANRFVAEALLTSLKCPATVVDSGAAALELLEREQFDLILMDCQMPGMDGYETTRRIRGLLDRHVPIVAMTANGTDEDRWHCEQAGMDGFLAKPFGRSALNDTLCAWLAPKHSAEPASDADKLASLPAVDTGVFEELRQSLQWQREPLQRICNTFMASAERILPMLEANAADPRELRRQIHTLLGSSGMVGARRVEHIVRLLHANADRHSPEECRAMARLLRQTMSGFRDEFERRLGQAAR